MLLKWIGAGLIIAGCGGCGFVMAQNYKKEERYLRALIRILNTMINELNYRRPPLTQVLRFAADTTQGDLRKVMLDLSDELEGQITPDAACCMSVVLGSYARLPQYSRQILHQLGQSLGHFDLDGQLSELRAVQAECERLLEAHSADRESRIRNYQTLGLCAGAALAILFI